jgi:DNA-binding NarL/FixJ family response regulator
MKYKVLLADDHALFLDALRMVLEQEPDIEVVAQVCDGMHVLQAVLQTNPDVVCMDINMPGMNGVDATRQLIAHLPALKVIGLSGHDDAYQESEMAAAGAQAYVAKCRAADEVVQVIRGMLNQKTMKVSRARK